MKPFWTKILNICLQLTIAAVVISPAFAAENAPPRILEVQTPADVLGVYDLLELTVDLEADYANPYDPDQVDLTAQFTAPSGKTYSVIGFYELEGYRSADYGGIAIATKKSAWKIRFTPMEAGEWSYQVNLRTPAGEAVSNETGFSVATGSSQKKGFLHVAADGNYFVYDDGTPYFALGENVAWWEKTPDSYDKWLPKLAEAGADYVRLWMASWSFALEWQDTGLGNYNNRQGAAYQLDYVLSKAEQLGINVMLCLQYHGQFTAHTNPQWSENPYNRMRGGFLNRPDQFFTDPKAIKLTKQKYRYIVARYGHYPNLLAWELFNEVNQVDNYNSAVISAWHQEMARYIRSIDPYGHMISTSFSRPDANDPAVWNLPEIDFTNTHFYNSKDMASSVTQNDQGMLKQFDKPTFIGEFGTDTRTAGADKAGVNLHNALWSSVFSGASGSAMTWWWDSYVHPLDLYGQYKSVADYLKGEDWPQAGWTSFTPRVVSEESGDLTFNINTSWGVIPDDVEFWASATEVRQPAKVAQYIYGLGQNTNLRTDPITFHLDFDQPVQFGVIVSMIPRDGSVLEIAVDGQVALEKNYPAGSRHIRTTDKNVVDVPAGAHTVTVQATGKDWLEIKSYNVYGGASQLRTFGQRTADQAFFWVQDRSHIWSETVDGYQPKEFSGATAALELPDGEYDVFFWDTWAGASMGETQLKAINGDLQVPLPSFKRDIALKVKPAQQK